VEDEGEPQSYEENTMVVSPSFFDVFTFDFVEGVKEDHIAQGNVFIPLSMARKLFGKESAAGKQIVFDGRGTQTVMASKLPLFVCLSSRWLFTCREQRVSAGSPIRHISR
jgi:hypothetical protein